MAEEIKQVEKKAAGETKSVKGAWDVKYRWTFRTDLMDRYVAGLKEKKLWGTRCPKCGRVYAPPKDLCGKCYEVIEDNWVEVKDQGELVTYTVGYTSITGQPYPEPQITGTIRFEGSDSWVLGPVKGVKPEDIKVGMKLKVVWRAEPKGQLSDIEYYAPAE